MLIDKTMVSKQNTFFNHSVSGGTLEDFLGIYDLYLQQEKTRDMSDNDIIELFREKKLRLTPQRMSIYRAVRELHHPTAEEVWELVRRKIPALTVATVYNTLECLVNAGLAEKVFTLDNKMYFDADTRPHQHLYDNRTHNISDLHESGLSD